MKFELFRRVLICRVLKPSLDLESPGNRGDDFFTRRAPRFGERERDRHGRRNRMRGRAPHRLEVEHVRSHRIDARGLQHRCLEAPAPDARLGRAAETAYVPHADLDRLLAAPRESNRDAVGNRLRNPAHALIVEIGVRRAMNDCAKLPRKAHRLPPRVVPHCFITYEALIKPRRPNAGWKCRNSFRCPVEISTEEPFLPGLPVASRTATVQAS